MAKIKFERNEAGIRELLCSQEMMNICKEYADAVRDRCGEGYEVTTYTGKYRANAQVAAATIEAYRSTLKHNTIVKALK